MTNETIASKLALMCGELEKIEAAIEEFPMTPALQNVDRLLMEARQCLQLAIEDYL